MTPHETLLDAVRRQAVRDVRVRWHGEGRSRRRIECGDHDAARCALDYLKDLRAIRNAATRRDWDASQLLTAYFTVTRR